VLTTLNTCRPAAERLSFCGFRCADAKGEERLVFPAIHSYLSDTPEAHKVASVMNWPAACANCRMPRDAVASGGTLDDIVRAGRWAPRTPQQSEHLYAEATKAGDAAGKARPDDPAARLRAATNYCEERGHRWVPSVLWCAPTCPVVPTSTSANNDVARPQSSCSTGGASPKCLRCRWAPRSPAGAGAKMGTCTATHSAVCHLTRSTARTWVCGRAAHHFL
jgi:hypothetical protein